MTVLSDIKTVRELMGEWENLCSEYADIERMGNPVVHIGPRDDIGAVETSLSRADVLSVYQTHLVKARKSLSQHNISVKLPWEIEEIP